MERKVKFLEKRNVTIRRKLKLKNKKIDDKLVNKYNAITDRVQLKKDINCLYKFYNTGEQVNKPTFVSVEGTSITMIYIIIKPICLGAITQLGAHNEVLRKSSTAGKIADITASYVISMHEFRLIKIFSYNIIQGKYAKY